MFQKKVDAVLKRAWAYMLRPGSHDDDRLIIMVADMADRDRRNPATLKKTSAFLRYAAQHADEMVRMTAVEELGEIGTARDIPALAACRKDTSYIVRASVYSSLAARKRRSAAGYIRSGLHDSDPLVRRYAAVALFDLLGCESKTSVERAARRDPDPLAQVGYHHVLAACGNAGSFTVLEEFAKHPERWLSSPAESALLELTGAAGGGANNPHESAVEQVE